MHVDYIGPLSFLLLIALAQGRYDFPSSCPQRLQQYSDYKFSAYNSVCYMYDLTYLRYHDSAERTCEQFGGSLVLIKSQDVSNHLISVLKSFSNMHNVAKYWIGLSDRDTEGTFVWADGSPLQWSNWHPGYTQNDYWKDCAFIEGGSDDFQWFVQACNNDGRVAMKHYICQFDQPAPITTPKPYPATTRHTFPAECPKDLAKYDSTFRVHNDVCYMFNLPYLRTYTFAENKCEQLGGTLAIVKSSDVSDFLISVLKSQASYHNVDKVWIGLNDIDTEGKFTWEDGTPLQWSHWHVENAQNDYHKDCVFMIGRYDYQWFVQACYNDGVVSNKPYICQFSSVVPTSTITTTTTTTTTKTTTRPTISASTPAATSPECIDKLDNSTCQQYDCSGHSGQLLCPKTCGLCDDTKTTLPSPCADKMDSFTCQKYDCRYPAAQQLCPVTCGLCGSTQHPTQQTPPSAAPLAQCPSNLNTGHGTSLVAHGGLCYLFELETKLNYNDAESTCERLGGSLVLVKDMDMSIFLNSQLMAHSDLFKNYEDGIWIGLSDADTENRFQWQDGTVVTYNQWDGGDLSGSKNDQYNDCVYFYPSTKKWYTEACDSDQKAYVCQFNGLAFTTSAPAVPTTIATTKTSQRPTTTTTTPKPTTTTTTPKPTPKPTTTATTTTTTQKPTTTTTTPKPTTKNTPPKPTTTTTTPKPTTTTITPKPTTTATTRKPTTTTTTLMPTTTAVQITDSSTAMPTSATKTTLKPTTATTTPKPTTTTATPKPTATTTTPKPTTTTATPKPTTTTTIPKTTTTIPTTPIPTTATTSTRSQKSTTPTTTPMPPTTTTTTLSTPLPTTTTAQTTKQKPIDTFIDLGTTADPLSFLPACKPFTCDIDCGLDGYQVDTEGCSVCLCNA